MASYGMYYQVVGNMVKTVKGILLDRKNEAQRNGEIQAVEKLNKAEGLQLQVVEKMLCFGHHEPKYAEPFLMVEVAGNTYGTDLAKKITFAGQILMHGNPNNKELFPKKQ